MLMPQRRLQQLVTAFEVTEGAGVTVHRTIGTPPLRHLDPFLMLDHFSSDRPDDYIAGFPDHPHRGFVTLTYMIDGHMLHEDSMGSRGDLRAGGIQWMKAASGVIHSEMPQQTNGLMRGFQLWINLPAAEKMSAPAYQDYAADKIPVIEQEGMTVKLISGSYHDRRGPIDDPHTDLHYLDVTLHPGQAFDLDTDNSATTFIYPFEGDLVLADTAVRQHGLAVLTPGDRINITAGTRGARFLVLSGQAIGEPVVQYGPFVMNTREEIQQAFDDYNNGTLVRPAH